jgi:hypothetical protein
LRPRSLIEKRAAAYAEALAGRNVGETLLAAGKVCEEGVKALRAANTPPREVDRETKSLTLYHCVYPEENFEEAAKELFDLVAHTNEFHAKNPKPQRGDLPEELLIYTEEEAQELGVEVIDP